MFDVIVNEVPEVIEVQEEAPIQQIKEEQIKSVQGEEKKVSNETIQQNNFRRLREDSERVARERDDALRLVETYKRQQPVQQEQNYHLAPDDLVEGKHYNQTQQEIKETQQEIKDLKRELHLTTTQLRLKAEFHDFANVVTKENVEELKRIDPDIARVLETSTDLEAIARIAYKSIKNSVLTTQSDPYIDDKLRAQANANKPRSLASVSPQQGESPLSRANAFANGLTDELKQQLLKEMEEARRGI